MRPDPNYLPVLRAFSDSRVAQMHVAMRLFGCPVRGVLDRLPSKGSVLDIGCGHGLLPLLAALEDPDRRLVASDIDPRKLDTARHAAGRLGLDHRVQFIHTDPNADAGMPALTGGEDAVMIVDVLYLMGTDRAVQLLRDVADALAPGGVLLVKEMASTPGWKACLNRLQETVATRVLRYTAGNSLEFVPAGVIRTTMESMDLEVEEVRLDRCAVHPHLLMIGRRPAGPPRELVQLTATPLRSETTGVSPVEHTGSSEQLCQEQQA